MAKQESGYTSIRVYPETHKILRDLHKDYKTGIAAGYHRAVLLLRGVLSQQNDQPEELSEVSEQSVNGQGTAA